MLHVARGTRLRRSVPRDDEKDGKEGRYPESQSKAGLTLREGSKGSRSTLITNDAAHGYPSEVHGASAFDSSESEACAPSRPEARLRRIGGRSGSIQQLGCR